jgi:hypothetical protein
MSIQCSCPECGYCYEVAGELAGKSVLCPECQTRFKPKGIQEARKRRDEEDYDVETKTPTRGRREHEGDIEARRQASRIPVWVWVGGGAAFGLLVLGGLVAVGFLGAMAAKNAPPPPTGDLPISVAPDTTGPGGRYPAPTTKFQGRTATHWGEEALDANEATCFNALQALNALEAEGTPFILTALETHARRGNTTNVSHCLGWLTARDVDTRDIGRVVAFLDDRYARNDGGSLPIRPKVVGFLRFAGPRAREHLPALERLRDHPQLGVSVAAAIEAIRG